MSMPAFLLFGTTRQATQELREACVERMSIHPDLKWRDCSTMAYVDIQHLTEKLEALGFMPTIYVKATLPKNINESWLMVSSTYGMLRQGKLKNVIVLEHGIREMVTHMETVLEAEGQAPKPKVPGEVDRLRTQQKQEALLQKKRQNDQLLQAQQRELQKKSREQEQKITKPKTGAKQE